MNVHARDEMANRPCLIVAQKDAAYAAQISRSFRRVGWDVYIARSGPEARRLAQLLQPDLMVLATDLDEESGWLTCEKITRDLPQIKVFLVDDQPENRTEDFARFVGAVALVDRNDSVTSLVEEVCGRPLPVAG